MRLSLNKFGVLSAIVLGGAVTLAFALERLRPLRPPSTARGPRRLRNLALASCSGLVVRAAVLPSLVACANISRKTGLGVLPVLRLGEPFESALGFMLLDLGIYAWHRMNHEASPLWRLHRVHHADLELDVTTGFRFHPIEVLLSSVGRGLQVLLIGPGPALLLGYELLMQVATAFHHSNIQLSRTAERWVGAVLITPPVHGVHHSLESTERNSNYGVVLSVWDRLLRSRSPEPNVNPPNLGVPELRQSAQQTLVRMLLMPFARSSEEHAR